MNYEVEINGRIRLVSVVRADGVFHVTIDGRWFEVDATRIDANTLSLIVTGGDEVRLTPDAAPGEEGRLTPDATQRSNTHVPSAFRKTYDVTVAPDPATLQLAVRVGAARVVLALNGRRRFSHKDDAVDAL